MSRRSIVCRLFLTSGLSAGELQRFLSRGAWSMANDLSQDLPNGPLSARSRDGYTEAPDRSAAVKTAVVMLIKKTLV